MDPKPMPLELDADSRVLIEQLASRRSRDAGRLVREAIEQYVSREARRDAFEQAAEQAWRRFGTDGLHASGAEVDAWLSALEAGEAREPPECHA